MARTPFQDLYPGWPAEAYEEMGRLHSGPIPPQKKHIVLKAWEKGMTRAKVCKEAHISPNALQISLGWEPEFKQRWDEVGGRRTKDISDNITERLMVGSSTVTIVKECKRNFDGTKMYDANGKPVLEVIRETTVMRPPEPILLEFWASHCLKKFGKVTEGAGTLPIEDLRQYLENKVNADETPNSTNNPEIEQERT